MNKDLSVGKPYTVIWKYCLPLFGSIVFQQLYNIADSLVAGRFIDNNALAAVGNAYEITLLFIAFAFGCNIGCSVVVARLFAAKKYGDLKTAVYTTLIACAVLCGALMLVGELCCKQFLRLIQTPSENGVLESSYRYLQIYIYGLPFVFFYNVATGIFSALGDSKTPFFFLAASSLCNIGMDIAFVTLVKWGVTGIAWATFLCQGVSCALAVGVVFYKLKKLPKEGAARAFSWQLFRAIAVIAIPSILQQSFISVGNIIIQSAVNSFGTEVMAGYSAAVKLHNLIVTSFTTLANGISNFTSQNLGAEKPERVRSGFFAGLKLVWLICIPLILLYEFAGRWLILLFMNDEYTAPALDTGIMFLRIVSPFYLIVSAKLVADGVLRGARLMVRFMIATFIDLILRVVLAEIFSLFWGETGIWIAWPIGWAVALGFSLFFCFTRPLSRGKSSPQT